MYLVWFSLITLAGLGFAALFLGVLGPAPLQLLGSLTIVAAGVYGLWEESRQ